jgi:uridine kinase
MSLYVASRRELLKSLVDEILHNYGHGRILVAVDGAEGTGTAQFADGLADVMRFVGHAAFRASISDFHKPRADRDWHGRGTGRSYYEDSFDYSLLRRVLIDPYRMGGSTGFVTAGFDLQRDAPIEPKWMTGPQDAVLIVDGIFLNRPDLAGLWHYSVFLEKQADFWAGILPAETDTVELESDPSNVVDMRLREGWALYVDESKPRESATAIIDNSDPEHPRRVFADSC